MPIHKVKTAVRSASEVWSLAWPTVITMTSYTLMQFVDSIMVAQLGPLELAAQGNGGVWSWTIIAFLVGAISLVNTFVSQSVGAGSPRERRDMHGRAFGLRCCRGLSFFFRQVFC